MKTKMMPSQDARSLAFALSLLQEGGLVAFPTDTVYGLGALVFHPSAVRSLYAVKGRSAEKAIPVLMGDAEDLGGICPDIPDMAASLAARFWPGPITLVVPGHPDLPLAVSTNGTVGVRVPDHPVARALLRRSGPMAVTSANRSGRSSPTTADEVMDQIGGRIALILDGGRTPGGVPSTVINCMGAEPQILRQGPVTLTEINAVLFP